MKKILLLFFFFFITYWNEAAILRCKNNPLAAGPVLYCIAQTAHDAEAAGDTLHLEPKIFGSYGDFYANKKTTVNSIGFWVNENLNTQANDDHGICDIVVLYPGNRLSTSSLVCLYFLHNSSLKNVGYLQLQVCPKSNY